MNTRATSILMMIFEVLAVVLVVFTTAKIATAYGKSETVMKINTAEDLRMMIDTLAGVPGEALVKYPHDVGTFSFLLRAGSISVFTKGENEQFWVVRKFSLPDGYQVETEGGVIEKVQAVCLEKNHKKILLRPCQ